MTDEEIDVVHFSDFEVRSAGMRVDPVSTLAWILLKTHPLIAGKATGEDSSGRARIGLQTAEETVDRCFGIAESWYAEAKARSPGPIPTRIEAAVSEGRIKRAMNRSEFLQERLPETT